MFVWCLCHQSNLVLMTLGLAPASNSIGKNVFGYMCVCHAACMFMVVGATVHRFGLDVTALVPPMVCESIIDSKTVTTSFLEYFPLFK